MHCSTLSFVCITNIIYQKKYHIKCLQLQIIVQNRFEMSDARTYLFKFGIQTPNNRRKRYLFQFKFQMYFASSSLQVEKKMCVSQSV